MKKKSGKKKKSKSSGKAKGKKTGLSDGDDQLDAMGDGGPPTLISGDDVVDAAGVTEGGKKKRKKGGKKKKLSKSEKSLEKLEKQIEKIKQDEEGYERFVCRMHTWLVEHATQAIVLYKHIDVDGEGLLSYDEFKGGLFDLNVPATKVEIHLLCKLLDEEDSGEIDYLDLGKGLQFASEINELERQRVRDERQLIVTQRKFPPCPCCKKSVVEPWRETLPRFIGVELRSVTFDNFQDYPGHIELLVHSHIPICGLIQLIIAETDISSTKIAVFTDRSRSPDSVLSPHMTLEDCGYQGDNRDTPEEIVLFYDYTVEFTECPILMCDHYFGQKIDV